MAQEKAPPKIDTLEEIIFLLAGLVLVGVLMSRLAVIASGVETSILGTLWVDIVKFFRWFMPIWKVLAIIIIVTCTFWSIYSYRKRGEVLAQERSKYGPLIIDPSEVEAVEVAPAKNPRWKKVLDLSYSNNPSDWRLAILEADIMLEEALRARGHAGDGLGEMLKGIDRSDMLTIESAWEAHKVRNRIAHAGGEFELNERETRRVISHFEEVFKELEVI